MTVQPVATPALDRDVPTAAPVRAAVAVTREAVSAEAVQEERLHYPYGAAPLLPMWSSSKARVLAVLTALAGGFGGGRGAASGWPPNDIALLALFPALLAITLAFAPAPRTRLGTIAKDLLCIATAGAAAAGPVAHLMILGIPILLAAAVALDRGLPKTLAVTDKKSEPCSPP
jgi:hypothetical protein